MNICLELSAENSYYCLSSDANQDDIISNGSHDVGCYVEIKENQYLKVRGNIYSLDKKPKTVKMNGSGVFKVGLDIRPGEYYVQALEDGVYISVIRDIYSDDIVYNGSYDNGCYVKVEKGQYLEISKGEIFSLDKAPKHNISDGSGMFKVGRDIKPGLYYAKATGDSEVYVVVSEDVSLKNNIYNIS